MKIRDYEDIFSELGKLSDQWSSILVGKKWAYSGGASYAIYRLIPRTKLKFDLSPVMLTKSQKNEV